MQDHDNENEEPRVSRASRVMRWLGDLRHHILLFCALTLLNCAALYVLRKYFADWSVTEYATRPEVVATTVLLILASTSYIGEPLGILTRRFSKVVPPISRRSKREWALCAKRIKDEKPDRLRLLVFTGASTFGYKGTPLHSALMEYEKDLQILIALPDSDAFERVIKKLRNDRRSEPQLRQLYLDQHHAARDFCRELAQRVPEHLRSIEVRGYAEPVIWKMVSFHDYLWLQHYCLPRSVDETPAYVFGQTSDSSLVIPLEYTFDSYWESATLLLRRDSDRASTNDWEQGPWEPDPT